MQIPFRNSGIPRNSAEFRNYEKPNSGIPRNSAEFRGITEEFLGIPEIRNSEFRNSSGIPEFLGIPRNSSEFGGISRNLMNSR